MKDKKQFTTESQASKVHGGFGWHKLTGAEAHAKAEETVPLRRVDSGNLARLATAAGKIANSLARIAKAMERESERV